MKVRITGIRLLTMLVVGGRGRVQVESNVLAHPEKKVEGVSGSVLLGLVLVIVVDHARRVSIRMKSPA